VPSNTVTGNTNPGNSITGSGGGSSTGGTTSGTGGGSTTGGTTGGGTASSTPTSGGATNKKKYTTQAGQAQYLSSGESITGFSASVTQTGVSSLSANAFAGAGSSGLPGYYDINQLLNQPTVNTQYLLPGQGSLATVFNVPAIYQWVRVVFLELFCAFALMF